MHQNVVDMQRRPKGDAIISYIYIYTYIYNFKQRNLEGNDDDRSMIQYGDYNEHLQSKSDRIGYEGLYGSKQKS